MAQPPYQPPHRRVAHGLARHTLQVASPFRGTRRRALGEVRRKQPPYGVVALRRSARRLPRSQRDPIALHPGEALHRGEAHPEEVGGLALGHGALLEGIDYLASEIFGVGFHVCMISCGSRFLLTAVSVFLCCPMALVAVNNHVKFTGHAATLELAETEVTEEHWSRRTDA